MWTDNRLYHFVAVYQLIYLHLSQSSKSKSDWDEIV